MSTQTLQLTEPLIDYLHKFGLREHPIQAQLRILTSKHARSVMQISPEQGQFMGMLAKLINAKQCIEIGTFTGYSALSVALNLPKDGKLIACDISSDYTDLAKPYWKQAGVDQIIDLNIAPASETLSRLITEGRENSFDMAFIDADKTGYDTYYELCLKLIRPGGLILIDNVLWSGHVAEATAIDEDTIALKALNKKIHQDDRVDMMILPISDGLSLIVKR
ncbi:class I SAM-dependent methyltransferase [Endozoicomonas ascidiicola]|uniref:class I SAM-dependent methyltransferase n=1 Tax=Endozoicomonas ascidiicola TaxID=1698521 RepID=UPI0008379BBF|nr:class I SAM-dependent methyltransferase [Endozoicomonas ascidiicola]